jgi:hypothetical protein
MPVEMRHLRTSPWSGQTTLNSLQATDTHCLPLKGSVRRMTGRATTTSICSKAVDRHLGKAYGDLTGYPAKMEHESGAG